MSNNEKQNVELNKIELVDSTSTILVSRIDPLRSDTRDSRQNVFKRDFTRV